MYRPCTGRTRASGPPTRQIARRRAGVPVSARIWERGSEIRLVRVRYRGAPAGYRQFPRVLGTDGSANASKAALLSLMTMSFGVPLGAKSAYQADHESAGQPISLTVGTSGATDRTGVTSLDWVSYPVLRFAEHPDVTPVVVRAFDRGRRGGDGSDSSGYRQRAVRRRWCASLSISDDARPSASRIGNEQYLI